MNKNFAVLAYFFGCLLIIAIFARGLSLFIDREEVSGNDQTSTEKILRDDAILYKDANGNIKYASGSCSSDMDCIPTGCSQEMCASEQLFSTCEVKSDVPDNSIYDCGCYKGYCAWIQK